MANPNVFHSSSSGFSAGRDLIFQLTSQPNDGSLPDTNSSPSDDRITLLHLAVQRNLPEAIQRLSGCPGIDINATCSLGLTGLTALHYAAMHGHDACVRELLKYPGVEVNAMTEHGLTPLHLAVLVESEHCVEGLLGYPGINVNIRCLAAWGGFTPLHMAWHPGAKNMGDRVVEMLLANPEVDVNAKDGAGETALYKACSGTKESTVKLFLQRSDIDVHAYTDIGATVLHAVATKGSVSIYNLLIDSHPDLDINARVTMGPLRGVTTLHLASIDGHVSLVRELLQHPRINIMAQNPGGVTPIAVAAQLGNNAVVACFLDHSPQVDINIAVPNNGCTPLHLAASNGHQEIVQTLLRFENIEVNVEDRQSQTALGHAIEHGHQAVAALLAERGGRLGRSTWAPSWSHSSFNSRGTDLPLSPPPRSIL